MVSQNFYKVILVILGRISHNLDNHMPKQGSISVQNDRHKFRLWVVEIEILKNACVILSLNVTWCGINGAHALGLDFP